MSQRDRVADTALGLVVGLAIALLILVWAVPRFRDPADSKDRQQHTEQTTEGNEKPVETPGFWKTYATPSDTYAQWIAAFCALFSVGVSTWAVWLVRSTLVVNQRATEATENAVAATREMGELQTRAYLAVTGGTVVYYGSRDPQVFIRVRNAGNSPAFNVTANFQRSNANVFNEEPTGGHVEGTVSIFKIAKIIQPDSEGDYLIGAFGKTDDPGPGIRGPGFNVDGLLEYQTVFDVKTGNIDMDSTFLFLFGPSRAKIAKAIQEGKELRLPMQLMPQFSSGWIVDYRRIMRSAREKARREKQGGKQA